MNRARSAILTVVWLFGLFFLSVGIYFGFEYQRTSAAVRAYHADPNCCTDVGANIVNLESTYAGSRTNSALYGFEVRSGYGDMYDVSLPDRSMYDRERRGDYVTIRVYHDKVIKVTAQDGSSTPTRSDPDWALASYGRALMTMSIGFAICVVVGVGLKLFGR